MKIRLVLIVLVLYLSACGNASSADIAGLWERELPNAAGPPVTVLLDMRDDGSYVLYGTGWLGDRGRYRIDGDKLIFESAVDQRHNAENNIDDLDAERLVLARTLPFPQTEKWTRSKRPSYFTTETVEGHEIPHGVAGLALATLTADVWSWHEDASPTWIDIQRAPNDTFSIEVRFYSATAREEMIVHFGAYEHRISTDSSTSAFVRPLDLDFLDLPAIMREAYKNGQSGPLARATLQSYPKFGAVWGIATGAPRGLAIDARTGVVINEDVTGYVARYNADWARAAELWRQAFRSRAGSETEQCSFGQYKTFMGCQDATSEWECEHLVSGSWSSHSGGGGSCF